MATNICVIIKNSHSWFREPSEYVCSKTIETLSRFFTGKENSHIVNKDNDSVDDECIDILYGNMKLHTKDGYWILDTLCDHRNFNPVLRELIFDIAVALKAKEVMYFADKFDFVYEKLSYNEIINCIEDNKNDFMINGIVDDGSSFRDAFADLMLRFTTIKRHNGICLMPYARDYSIMIDDTHLFLEINGKRTLIDDYNFGLNGPEITIFKDGKSAIIKPDGQFLSGFVVGNFYWEHGDTSVPRFIINKESDIRIPMKN